MRGRDIVIDVDHGSNSKHAFDWALIHFCRLADAIHLIHDVSSMNNKIAYDANQIQIGSLPFLFKNQNLTASKTQACAVTGE
ncbi:hypothetical protein ACE6H2_001387 [Prunus campanulata]